MFVLASHTAAIRQSRPKRCTLRQTLGRCAYHVASAGNTSGAHARQNLVLLHPVLCDR